MNLTQAGVARGFVNLPLTVKSLRIPLIFLGAIVALTLVGLAQGGSARRAAELASKESVPQIAAVNRAARKRGEPAPRPRRLWPNFAPCKTGWYRPRSWPRLVS